ncbi:MAG: DNA replication/repair protein RecF [Bacteroidales bacterium]|nr:DNA replication/repair protein RecF [Bacteroidales bacterium]
MTLERLILTNFKNYAEADVALCGNVNCFVGNNGAGKTNLLDAVYYLSFCKSYFNPVDSQNIRMGEDFFAIHGHYGDGDDRVSLTLRRGQGKQLKWNKKVCKTLAEHIGKVPLVMVSPNDQQLITGGSDLRRKFLDGVISQTDHQYLDHLLRYTKALEQRNRLLKQMWDDRLWDDAMVGVWDAQLVSSGEFLTGRRERFVHDFAPIFAEYYHWIAGTDEPGTIVYRHDGRPLLVQLQECRQADKYSQYTNAGPHKDDLLFLLSEADAAEEEAMPLKKFGSQGQQKSFALALKLAQFQYMLNHSGEKPILLLDDIFDKLDLLRIKRLIALVGSERFGQVFLTDTQPGRVQAIFDELPELDHKIFTVAGGMITLNL